MELDLKAIYHDNETGKVLCFTHAVKAAMEGHIITPEIDEFGISGNDMRNYHCQEGDCYE